jgi:hypothetical protein
LKSWYFLLFEQLLLALTDRSDCAIWVVLHK